eukprot:c4133_g2_i1 orf=184-441(+)
MAGLIFMCKYFTKEDWSLYCPGSAPRFCAPQYSSIGAPHLLACKRSANLDPATSPHEEIRGITIVERLPTSFFAKKRKKERLPTS